MLMGEIYNLLKLWCYCFFRFYFFDSWVGEIDSLNFLVELVYMGGKFEMRVLYLLIIIFFLVEGRCGDYVYGLFYLVLIIYFDQSYFVVVFYIFIGYVVGLGVVGDGGFYVRLSERFFIQIGGVQVGR